MDPRPQPPSPYPINSVLLTSPPPAPPSTPFAPPPPTLLPSPPLLAPPTTTRPRLKRSHTTSGGNSGLEAIREAVSPDERAGGGGAGTGTAVQDEWIQGLQAGLEGARIKRLKREPDHEAFANLSLVNSLSPGAPTSQLHPPPPPPPIPPYPTLVPPAPSSAPFGYPSPAPSSTLPVTPPMQQGESHLSSYLTPTTAFPTEPTPSPQSLGFAPAAPTTGLGLLGEGGVGMEMGGAGAGRPPSYEESFQDEEMRPNRGTYDLDPHRVYIASLSDDDDDEEEEAPTRTPTSLELHPTLLARTSAQPFPPSPLPPELLASTPGAGSLILYRPLKFGRELEEQEEEERRGKREEELRAFRREQAMQEREEEVDVERMGEVEEGVEMMDLDG